MNQPGFEFCDYCLYQRETNREENISCTRANLFHNYKKYINIDKVLHTISGHDTPLKPGGITYYYSIKALTPNAFPKFKLESNSGGLY